MPNLGNIHQPRRPYYFRHPFVRPGLSVNRSERFVGSNILDNRRRCFWRFTVCTSSVWVSFVHSSTHVSSKGRTIQSVHAVRRKVFARGRWYLGPSSSHTIPRYRRRMDWQKGSILHIFSYTTQTSVNRFVKRKKLRKNLHVIQLSYPHLPC